MDLSDIPDLIKNETNYKYFLHILDHYSKYLFDELLTNKKAETIISKLPNIFYINGFPEEICLDNGKEFRNKKLSKFLKDKNVIELHGLPRNPHSQGACERVYQTITKDLISKILEKSAYDYNKLKIDYKNIIFNYNNINNSSTKFKPIYLFFNNTEELSKKVKNNCNIKFKNVNQNAYMYKKGDKVLLNNKFLIKGNTLIYNKIKNKKRLYRYPCEIIKILGGGFYNIKLSVNYSSVGIKKMIYIR